MNARESDLLRSKMAKSTDENPDDRQISSNSATSAEFINEGITILLKQQVKCSNFRFTLFANW